MNNELIDDLLTSFLLLDKDVQFLLVGGVIVAAVLLFVGIFGGENGS